MLKNPKELSKLGVARISYGLTPYIQALESFKAIADQTIMSAKT